MPALIPPETVLALSPRALRALLSAAGASRALLAKPPIAIARSLFCDEHPAAVIAAFAPIDRFTHGVGPEALAEGARVAGYAIGASAIAQGPADVAAEMQLAVLAMGATAIDARRSFARGNIRADRFFVPRASYELVGSAGSGAPGEPDLERHLRAWLGEAFRAFWHTSDSDGRLHAAVLYVAPPSVAVTWPADQPTTPRRDVTELVFADIARIDFTEHRLLVTPAIERHMVPLARAVGAGVHGNPGYYALRSSFSFKTLQRLGALGFARLARPEGVRAWSVVGCQLDSGREELFEARSEDALGSLEARTTVDGGYFPRLTLRVLPEPESPRGRARATPGDPVDLFIQLPHRITVSDPRQERLARRAGKALGMFEPGALPDDVRSLAPWVHFEWRWREVLGDEAFELLVRKKTLLKVKAKRGVAKYEHRLLGSSVKLTAIPGEDVQLATPLDFSLPAFDVEESEAHAWRLDVAALAKDLGHAMGLRAGGVTNVTGAMTLGALIVKSGRAHVYYAAGRPPKGLVAAVRAACKLGATPVLCVPWGHRLEDEGIVQVEMDLLEQFGVAATTGLVTGRIGVGVGVEGEIDGWRLAGVDEVLVIDRKAKKIWLLGVELIHLVDGTFKLLERLAIEAGGAVDVRVLGEYVSNAHEPDVVVRKRRARLAAQIVKSFDAAGRVLPAEIADGLIVIDRRGAYRLGVGCKVI